MFDKILIANRAEIACRVIRTARRLGCRTAAIFSDADRDALHVALADEAFHVGPAPALESYLNVERILDAARRCGARAIHPGYGFLAENAEFAEACEAAGVAFIGPPADAIRAMGLKDAAKRIMEQAGVPVIPGWHGERQDDAHLASRADALGYPLLVKARAGGGGRGMRRVEHAHEFEEALASARREARAAFGDDAMLLEKFISAARHVEFQVFGDAHGNVVHLFERDCSLQRRNQKVIEEAPAPGMTAELRKAMGEAAVRAARAVGYRGAGTVEFIVDAGRGMSRKSFYFMEMNTRLQVEHPVTEEITGQDLVEWQLRVAAGEPLPRARERLSIHGHAIEARVCAEVPERGFLPATGRLHRLVLPYGVRVDSGVREGDTVTPFYDSMIAKLVCCGPTRAAALARLAAALRDCQVAGCATNLGFLARLVRDERFVAGEVDTGLVEREMETLARPAAPPEAAVFVALLVAGGFAALPRPQDPWTALTGWRHFGHDGQRVRLEHGERAVEATTVRRGAQRVAVTLDGDERGVRVVGVNERNIAVEIDGRRVTAGFFRAPDAVHVLLDDDTWDFRIADRPSAIDEGEATEDSLRAPMPGRVVRVDAAPGHKTTRGEPLLVLEAMKMEHTLRAPRDGVVEEVAVGAGDQVEEGAVLLRLGAGE